MAGIGVSRRTRRFTFLLTAAVAAMVAFGVGPVQAAPPPGQWESTLNEEFNGTSLNTNRWTTLIGGTSNNNTGKCISPNSVSVSGGYLHLKLKNEYITCGGATTLAGALIDSVPGPGREGFTYTYGYVEWGVNLPGAFNKTSPQGWPCPTVGCIANWPQFWSRKEPNGDSEIDQMESLQNIESKRFGVACYHFHGFIPSKKERGGCADATGPGAHTFATDWEPGQPVKWYYDGVLVGQLAWEDLTEPGYFENQSLIGSYIEPVDIRAPLVANAEALVDYVKVWQRPKPTVTTDAASEVSPAAAKLNGSVYTNGLNTSYYFQYGKTTSYGSTAPAPPGTNIGSGPGYNYTWNNISGLEQGTTYHYRIVATNATGTSYGADREFTTVPPPNVAFIDATNGSTISKGRTSISSPWQEVSFLGHSARAGTRPAALTVNGVPYIFFVDSTNNNTLSYRVFNSVSNGWEQVLLGGHRVAAGSSPSAVVVNGTPHVLFVDADNNNTITDWTWYAGPGWQQNFYGGDPVTAGTSPTTTVEGGDLRAFFVNAKNNNTISSWVWNPEGRGQVNFGGDPVAAGSSPSAVRYNGDIRIFFSNASKSNTVSCWVWNQNGIGMTHFGGPAVAANSSPSVINNNGDIRVYFSDASKNRSISAWVWNQSGIGVMAFNGDQVTPGSSPSAVLFDGTAYIYFSDANRSNKLSVWEWGSSIQQVALSSHSLTEGTTPGATGGY